MKHSVILLLAMVTCFLFVDTNEAKAQCTTDKFMQKCAAELGDYVFVKQFDVRKARPKNRFAYVFSKGTTYIITVCDQDVDGNKMVMNLKNRSQKIVATNAIKKKVYPKIVFPCESTGMYYLEYTFQKSPDCGVSILGFKK